MLAATLGQAGDAEAHYQAALELEARVGSPPFLARTRYWYARTLLAAGGGEEREAARELLEAALADADRLGMARLADDTRELLATTPT